MANLIEGTTWEEDLYRIETTDPVEGGEDGVDNRNAKRLGARTRYLKALTAWLSASSGAATPGSSSATLVGAGLELLSAAASATYAFLRLGGANQGVAFEFGYRGSVVPTANTPSPVLSRGTAFADGSVVAVDGFLFARASGNVRVWRLTASYVMTAGALTTKSFVVDDVYVGDSVQGTGASAALAKADWTAGTHPTILSVQVANARDLTVTCRLRFAVMA